MEKDEGQLNTKAVPKFIQIVAGQRHIYDVYTHSSIMIHTLYALDEAGVVWIYDAGNFIWERMTSKQEEV